MRSRVATQRRNVSFNGLSNGRLARVWDLLAKGWGYALSLLERPRDVPLLVRGVRLERAHAGELIRLSRHGRWIRSMGIETVIDVGAHEGEFSSSIGCLLPHASIYAFEPLPDAFRSLNRRMARRPRFRAFPVALGDEAGTVTMWRSSFSESSSLLRMSDLHKHAFPWTSSCVPVDVEVRPLDAFASQLELRPKTLLKVDVQGYEDRVLRGASTILGEVDYVLVEVSFRVLYEGQASFESVREQLVDHGFRYAGSLDQLASPLDGLILQADALFIKSDAASAG
jgi:FkbM family methyltransferase